MITFQDFVCGVASVAGPFQGRPAIFLTLGLIAAGLMAACGGGSSNAPAGELPGTEEFGLSRQGLVEAIEAVEANIAECMNEAGFEYVAVDYNTVRRGMTADKSLPGLSERGYFEQYGFGISTLYTGEPPQLADENTPAKIGLGSQNVETFQNLSPADQTAYNRTLFGDNPDATFAVDAQQELGPRPRIFREPAVAPGRPSRVCSPPSN